MLKVTRGNPTPEELAAALAVVHAGAARAAAAVQDVPGPPDTLWTHRATLLRMTPRPGPHAWRASARVR